ncbi:hypothetical protein [Variovorax sp. SRS16]|uniref:hypothetical protein n=1 Tax=Variovorax sp. SRS16 TaxID=282217 RepID=UPI0013A54A3E|nr:hypothetical protein [Variovorax sp. SRS16]
MDTVAVKSGPSNMYKLGGAVTLASPGGDAFGAPRSERLEIAVGVSVIDGADRLVYGDVRDRWMASSSMAGQTTFILAAEQAANEVRRRHLGADGAPLSEPRTVRTIER